MLSKLRMVLCQVCEDRKDDDMEAVRNYVLDASWAKVVEADMKELERSAVYLLRH